MAVSRERVVPGPGLGHPSALVGQVTLAFALLILIWPILTHAVELWGAAEEFSFGFLVGPVAGGIIWWRRDQLSRSITTGDKAGLGIALLALIVYLVARRVDVQAVAGIAFCPLVWGIAVYMWGWQAGRVLAFPVGFLAFGL